MSKLLLRHGIVYTDGAARTGAHHAWLARQHLDSLATRMAFDAEHEAVLATLVRRDRLDAATTEMAAESQFIPVVHRLCCLHGVSTLSGFAFAVEIGDWRRFTGNMIGAFVGLAPCEHSSGASRSQGPITKTGNAHARRLLVEAARHHRPQYRIGVTMRARGDNAPAGARARGDAGDRRLHERWVQMLERMKRPSV